MSESGDPAPPTGLALALATWRQWEAARATLNRRAFSELGPRRCAIAWYVCGIAYERDASPLIRDHSYDALSAWLFQHLDAARAAGADTLDPEDLRAGTAMNWRAFPAWAHSTSSLLRGARAELAR